MEPIELEFGKPNPKAPPELSQFAFLIGKWRGEAKVKVGEGEWQRFEASWVGRFILDGYVIADEYQMTSSSGDPIVLGMNFRAYDAAKQTWNIKWLNAKTGRWTDLGSEEMGGVRFEEDSIVYALKEPMTAHAYTRATYTNISETHFTWLGESSESGVSWSEFMRVECYRRQAQTCGCEPTLRDQL